MHDRQLENVYFANIIEVTETGIDVSLHLTCISNLSSNKKIGIRRIAADIEPNKSYSF
jgi:hypothetical protein